MKRFVLLIFTFLTFAGSIFGQVENKTNLKKSESPYDVMNVKFVLEGTPAAEDVGFSNPKSYWQIGYELRFLSDKSVLPYGFVEKENESPKERTKRIRKDNKEIDNFWKKKSVLVIKGKVPKAEISNASNREINIPVKLPPEVFQEMAQAVDSEQVPSFRIKMKAKVYTEIDSTLKLKDKVKISFECPIKMKIGSKQEWMMNTCGVSTEVIKEDGKIRIGLISLL